MRRLRLSITALFLLACGAQALGAQIEIVTTKEPPRKWLMVGRVVVPGDERRFHELAETAPDAVVVLSGPGGSVAAALAIGEEIRQRRLGTLVPANTDCASACSLIWLAGSCRMLGAGARIGFHAASIPQSDGSRMETHAVDEFLRRYLDSLGFAADTTATIVNTQSAFVRWLEPIELRANGIASEAYP